MLEELGFAVSERPQAEFQLIRPIGLRYIQATEQSEREAFEGFAWDSWRQGDVEREAAHACLWDFIQAVDATPETAMAFIQKWGVFQAVVPNRAGTMTLADFVREAEAVRNFLLTLVATEHGELVQGQTLESFADSDRDMIRELEIRPGVQLVGGPGRPAADENRRRRWRGIRTQGKGLELQRRLLCDFLDDKYAPAQGWTMWDERGRWNFRVESGVKNIVWSHLYSIFMAPELDIYICSICSQPFEFDEANALRRPRSGTRAFCSDRCRGEARRQSNRQSWARNSERWRPRRRREQ